MTFVQGAQAERAPYYDSEPTTSNVRLTDSHRRGGISRAPVYRTISQDNCDSQTCVGGLPIYADVWNMPPPERFYSKKKYEQDALGNFLFKDKKMAYVRFSFFSTAPECKSGPTPPNIPATTDDYRGYKLCRAGGYVYSLLTTGSLSGPESGYGTAENCRAQHPRAYERKGTDSVINLNLIKRFYECRRNPKFHIGERCNEAWALTRYTGVGPQSAPSQWGPLPAKDVYEEVAQMLEAVEIPEHCFQHGEGWIDASQFLVNKNNEEPYCDESTCAFKTRGLDQFARGLEEALPKATLTPDPNAPAHVTGNSCGPAKSLQTSTGIKAVYERTWSDRHKKYGCGIKMSCGDIQKPMIDGLKELTSKVKDRGNREGLCRASLNAYYKQCSPWRDKSYKDRVDILMSQNDALMTRLSKETPAKDKHITSELMTCLFNRETGDLDPIKINYTYCKERQTSSAYGFAMALESTVVDMWDRQNFKNVVPLGSLLGQGTYKELFGDPKTLYKAMGKPGTTPSSIQISLDIGTRYLNTRIREVGSFEEALARYGEPGIINGLNKTYSQVILACAGCMIEKKGRKCERNGRPQPCELSCLDMTHKTPKNRDLNRYWANPASNYRRLINSR